MAINEKLFLIQKGIVEGRKQSIKEMIDKILWPVNFKKKYKTLLKDDNKCHHPIEPMREVKRRAILESYEE